MQKLCHFKHRSTSLNKPKLRCAKNQYGSNALKRVLLLCFLQLGNAKSRFLRTEAINAKLCVRIYGHNKHYVKVCVKSSQILRTKWHNALTVRKFREKALQDDCLHWKRLGRQRKSHISAYFVLGGKSMTVKIDILNCRVLTGTGFSDTPNRTPGRTLV